MWMMSEGLAPGVKNGDHAGFAAEVPRVGANHADGLGGRFKQDVIDDRLVLERDRGDRRRYCEYNMEVRHRQQIGATIGKPLRASQPLALWAVPITATIVGNANHAAVIALLDMSPERRGAAGLDGRHDAALVGQQPTALGGTESITVAAEYVRHLQRGPHRFRYSGGMT
jgi:hypothetical protein